MEQPLIDDLLVEGRTSIPRAVSVNSLHDGCPVDAAGELAGFRREFHRCLTRRADALFELTDALLCTDGPVKSLVGLSLAPEHRRGHGAGTWPAPQVATVTDTSRYGSAAALAWHRLHPRLTRRAAWLEHEGDLPVLEGTLIRLTVDHLPGDGDPKPLWLWSSRTDAPPSHVDQLWQTFLRRFDLEHTFRLFKQTLGWTAP
jgi:hypothetical protein